MKSQSVRKSRNYGGSKANASETEHGKDSMQVPRRRGRETTRAPDQLYLLARWTWKK